MTMSHHQEVNLTDIQQYTLRNYGYELPSSYLGPDEAHSLYDTLAERLMADRDLIDCMPQLELLAPDSAAYATVASVRNRMSRIGTLIAGLDVVFGD